MANIKISTQTSAAAAPPKANYGDLWVGKDGSFYATNQNGDAIKMALKSEVTAVQTTANAALPRANFESYGNLSTVEHWTGRYDTDGKKIYEKTLCMVVAGSGLTETNWNILKLKQVVGFNIVGVDPAGHYKPVPLLDNGGAILSCLNYIYTSDGRISLWVKAQYFMSEVLVTMQYTCTDR